MRRRVIPLARRLHQVCTTAVAEALGREEITALEYGVLAWLQDDPDIDQNALAARMGIDRTSASMLVTSLEERGFVDRRTNPLDRRARLLRLTSSGGALRARLRPSVGDCQAGILSALDPAEREMLLDLLMRVVTTNEAYMRPGGARRKPSRRSSP
jgi:DNA-binding MarR family transcriptional regulator